MNKKQLIKDIKNGKNLEVNLPQYANELLTNYYRFSLLRFTMEYFTYYEVICDNENEEINQVKDLFDELSDLIKESLLSEFDGNKRENVVKHLDSMRNNIIKKMKVLTAYTDILQIYEHVMNRVEYKFKDDVADIDDNSFANQIVEYIFGTKDNVIINEKIKEIIGQLPVRLTKSKYFDLLRNSLSVYKGAERTTFDNYIYMIETSAMLYKPEGMEDYFTNLNEFIHELKSVSFKNLDRESYEVLNEKLQRVANFIGNIVDVYVNLQEMVNNLYAVVLSYPYVTNEIEKESLICNSIIKEVYNNIKNEQFDSEYEEIERNLHLLEGKQEKIFEDYILLETVLFDIRTNHSNFIDSLMLSKQFDCLTMVQMLLSSSIFIETNELDSNEIADEDYIDQKTKRLIDDLAEFFTKNEQIVNRAVIANTLNKMPVFFNSSDEVIAYVNSSLTTCHDKAEKYASIQLISELMVDIE